MADFDEDDDTGDSPETDKFDRIFQIADDGAVPDGFRSLVEAILDGDKERAIDLLVERCGALVSYQHQKALYDAVAAGRGKAAA